MSHNKLSWYCPTAAKFALVMFPNNKSTLFAKVSLYWAEICTGILRTLVNVVESLPILTSNEHAGVSPQLIWTPDKACCCSRSTTMNAASGRDGCHAVPFEESTAATGNWPGNVVWLEEMTGLHCAKFPVTTVELRSGRRVGIMRVPLTAIGYVPAMVLGFAIYLSVEARGCYLNSDIVAVGVFRAWTTRDCGIIKCDLDIEHRSLPFHSLDNNTIWPELRRQTRVQVENIISKAKAR